VCHLVLFILLTRILIQVSGDSGSCETSEGNLEDAEKRLEGEEKTLFLNFVRRMLKWKPEERSSAEELLGDPWPSNL